MPFPPSKEAIVSLYRSLLREAKRLPHAYLRQFYYLRAQDEFRRLASTDRGGMQVRKFHRISKELSRLRRANDSVLADFNHILDMAYGRKGPLRYILMKPFLSDPTVPLPPRIIPMMPKSHPPHYTPELSALMGSPFARMTGKTYSEKELHRPPTLPLRSDPRSDDYRIFGPLSKRREVNIRWRFFCGQWKKTYPPLELTALSAEDSPSLALRRGFVLQKMNLLQEVRALASSSSNKPPAPRRQREVFNTDLAASGATSLSFSHTLHLGPTRFMRRRYKQLLGRIPIITRRPSTTQDEVSLTYDISLDPLAIHPSDQRPERCWADVDAVDCAWLAFDEAMTKKTEKL
ncbi:hypothetical protein K488DRAFT_54731 [Vararia minispora EC-137]|uniref:Uncharacterized protein n=1 Tax=Vararia minispora EC-137 TaxID=1314806 RepID=A0ACB8QEY5_9AGAM|nr:hypothetical protein K488DRAFT_54731 [Vararia minispora EC-137]